MPKGMAVLLIAPLCRVASWKTMYKVSMESRDELGQPVSSFETIKAGARDLRTIPMTKKAITAGL